MTVLLVLFTFASFLLIDYFRTRKAVVQPALQMSTAKQAAAVPRLQPALVGGFAVPSIFATTPVTPGHRARAQPRPRRHGRFRFQADRQTR